MGDNVGKTVAKPYLGAHKFSCFHDQISSTPFRSCLKWIYPCCFAFVCIGAYIYMGMAFRRVLHAWGQSGTPGISDRSMIWWHHSLRHPPSNGSARDDCSDWKKTRDHSCASRGRAYCRGLVDLHSNCRPEGLHERAELWKMLCGMSLTSRRLLAYTVCRRCRHHQQSS
jgi:hypothetical protein